MGEIKTSEQWQLENPDILVLDADGWDRNDFGFSWYEEEITFEEYNKRLFSSTVQMKITK